MPIREIALSDVSFPFRMVYQDTKDPASELPDHLHDRYEIVYVYNGLGTFFIDNTLLDMCRGDLFVIPGNTIHHAIPNAENPVTSTAVFFDAMLLQNPFFGDGFSILQNIEGNRSKNVYQFRLTKAEQGTAEAQLESIYKECLQPQTGYQQIIALTLQLMLIRFMRADRQKSQETSIALTSPAWFKDVLQHIENHLQHTITLGELANVAMISQSHLSRAFKRFVGLNLVDYITTKRMILAKELLINTDAKVATVCENCGFESLPHFHRTFKKYTGVTPATYRKLNGMSLGRW
ncbi:AraC family transcriptional regulator [Alicyclobacillus fodiniaquatilis]|uniref:Helix-turn-helix domain-containing protein n=1 Tax=Alicyclobacillus fodiniaquatilis TaxID=1661150 RepID=A0ABW4JRT9_9BACL